MALILHDKPAAGSKNIKLSLINTQPGYTSPIGTPTVDFGKDFEFIIKGCLVEKQMKAEMKDTYDGNNNYNVFDCISFEILNGENESLTKDVTIKNTEHGYSDQGAAICESEGLSVMKTQGNTNCIKLKDSKLGEIDYPLKGDVDKLKKRKKKSTKEQGKKRKWKILPTHETCFKLSLFPRVVTTDVQEIVQHMDKELVLFQEKCSTEEDKKSKSGSHACRYADNVIYVTKSTVTISSYNLFMYSELDLIIDKYGLEDFLKQKWKMPNTRLRSKKKWKTPKAHKQVKSKYCSSVQNGGHGKILFIKHRVIVLMNMQIDVYRNPNCISIKKIDKERGFKHGNKPANNTNIPPIIHKFPPVARNQTLGHALDAFNFDGALSADLVNILQNVQFREISPEDYDLLLRLDERVKPKTVDNNVLSSLKTDIVNEASDGVCLVCLDPYEIGQKRKFLPCGHAFHEQCINMWLTNSSNSCPIDSTEIS